MDRCLLSGASSTPPSPPAGDKGGFPTAGSKLTGTPPSVPGPYWFHAVTEELRNVVLKSGLVPDATQLDQVWQAMMLSAHPVGSIYQSTVNTDPSQLFGGEWVSLAGKVLVGAGDEFGVLTTGGAKSHRLTVDEMPKHGHSASVAAGGSHGHSGSASSAGGHTHTRGSMNITGSFGGMNGKSYSGAFYQATDYTRIEDGSGHDMHFVTAYMDASRNWTGETSSAGGHSHSVTVSDGGSHSHNVSVAESGSGNEFSTMPPYVAVYMWRRVA